jgi:membrane peptidoglycan carboxypeptidase
MTTPDGTFQGWQAATFGLAKSRNTMTARVGEMAGWDAVAAMTERLGLGEPKEKSPQLYIGNHGATLKALASAYSCLPTGGRRFTPFVIERVVTAEGDILYARDPASYQAMSPGAAWCVTSMLQAVMASGGTGASARTLGYKSPSAGKTGTTDDFKDAWFCGYNRRLTCGVWVGLDQPERIMGQGYGSRLALPIWADVMLKAEKIGCPAESPLPDVPTETLPMCRLSGFPATRACMEADTSVETTMPTDLIRPEGCPQHTGASRRPVRGGPSPGPNGNGFWGGVRRLFGG